MLHTHDQTHGTLYIRLLLTLNNLRSISRMFAVARLSRTAHSKLRTRLKECVCPSSNSKWVPFEAGFPWGWNWGISKHISDWNDPGATNSQNIYRIKTNFRLKRCLWREQQMRLQNLFCVFFSDKFREMLPPTCRCRKIQLFDWETVGLVVADAFRDMCNAAAVTQTTKVSDVAREKFKRNDTLILPENDCTIWFIKLKKCAICIIAWPWKDVH